LTKFHSTITHGARGVDHRAIAADLILASLKADAPLQSEGAEEDVGNLCETTQQGAMKWPAMQNGRIVMPPSDYTVTTQSPVPTGLAPLTTKIPGRNVLDLLGKVRAVASATLCAICSFIFVLMIHPDSSADWDAPTVVVWIVTLFAPLALTIWSLVTWPSWRSRALRWTRRFIACHLILAAAIPPLALSLSFGYALLPLLEAALRGVLLDILVLVLGPPASSAPKVLRLYGNSLLALSAAALGALFAWSFATIGLVAWQAETTAGEQRYCMTVPIDSEAHYRPVASLFDLRGLKLWAPVTPSVAGAPGSRRSNHLLLHIAGRTDPKLAEGEDRLTFWHWSYRQWRFLPPEPRIGPPDPWENSAIRPTRNSCVAEAHFVRHLPIFSQ
jgi:hypothetical protein